jgi:hypothetical protein
MREVAMEEHQSMPMGQWDKRKRQWELHDMKCMTFAGV